MNGAAFPLEAAIVTAQTVPEWQFVLIDYTATGWFVLQVIIAIAAIIILLSSIDDFYVDLQYWTLTLRRAFRRNRFGLPAKAGDLDKRPEQAIAIFVPAWQESEVIGKMIANTMRAQHYKNFHIFVGCYHNDPDTGEVVDQLHRIYPNVHRVDVGHDGPTSKADCLNWIVQGVVLFETQNDIDFAALVLHDAEDVIHPYSLKIINWVVPEMDLVQLPVFSMPRSPFDLVGGHYMDEFAEWHTKDMIVREWMTGIVPSAGVATAFSKRAILRLAAEEGNLPFNTDSLTEDYDIAQRFEYLGLRGAFVRHKLRVPREGTENDKKPKYKWRKEIVGTREFFPNNFSTAIRQKSRWMLGISFVGWEQIGWTGSRGNQYFLYRDRKALLTAPMAMIAYLVVLSISFYGLWVWLTPNAWQLAPLIEPYSMTWFLVIINVFFLVMRVLHRAFFVFQLYGPVHALISPLRIVVSNVVGFFAYARAFRQYFWSRLTGKRLTWDKTSHAYPSARELLSGRPKIGDFLVHEGAAARAAIDDALSAQVRTYRPLGLLLLDRGSVSDEALARAFGELAGYDMEPFDGLSVPGDVRDLLPQHIAARFGTFAVRKENGSRLIIAVAEPLTKPQRNELSRLISGRSRLSFVLAPRSDIAFAVRFAYGGDETAKLQRDMAVLKRAGMVKDEMALWTKVRRSYVKFGDLAVREGVVSHTDLESALTEFWGKSGRVGAFLVKKGVLSASEVDAVLASQRAHFKDVLSAAVDLGWLSEARRRELEREDETA